MACGHDDHTSSRLEDADVMMLVCGSRVAADFRAGWRVRIRVGPKRCATRAEFVFFLGKQILKGLSIGEFWSIHGACMPRSYGSPFFCVSPEFVEVLPTSGHARWFSRAVLIA